MQQSNMSVLRFEFFILFLLCKNTGRSIKTSCRFYIALKSWKKLKLFLLLPSSFHFITRISPRVAFNNLERVRSAKQKIYFPTLLYGKQINKLQWGFRETLKNILMENRKWESIQHPLTQYTVIISPYSGTSAHSASTQGDPHSYTINQDSSY